MLTRFVDLISRPGSSPGGVPIVSGAFTPEPSALLIARFGCQSVGSPSAGVDIGSFYSISDSAGLVWTPATSSASLWPWNVGNRVWWALAPLVPVPIVITLTQTSGGPLDLYVTGIDVVSYTGYDVAVPIGSAEGFADPVTGYAPTYGPWSESLAVPPVVTSEVLAFLSGDCDDPDPAVPGAGWTLIVDNTGYIGMFNVEARGGSVSPVVDWTYRLFPGTATGQSNMAVVEVRAAGPSGPSPSVLMPLFVGGL